MEELDSGVQEEGGLHSLVSDAAAPFSVHFICILLYYIFV